MRLTILPATIPVDVVQGVVATLRPFDPDGLAEWQDRFPKALDKNAEGDDIHRNVAAWTCVRERLVAIKGVEMDDTNDEGEVISSSSFDVNNDRHMASLPVMWINAMYLGLLERATLTRKQEKNSDSPSGSDGTTTTEISPVATVSSA